MELLMPVIPKGQKPQRTILLTRLIPPLSAEPNIVAGMLQLLSKLRE